MGDLQRDLSRRDLLMAAGVGVAGLYVAGCGGSDSKLPAKAASTSKVASGIPGPEATGGTPGGQLLVGWNSEANCFDPAIGYTARSWDANCNLTFAPLLVFSEEERAAAERRRGDARGQRRRPRLHHPAAPRRHVPPRPGGHGGGLQVRLGARARPEARELGRAATSTPSTAPRRCTTGRPRSCAGHPGRRRHDARGHADAARRHLPLRAHPAVHGAGAGGGGRAPRRRLGASTASATARTG